MLAQQAFAKLQAEGPIVDGRVSGWNAVLEKAHRSSVALAAKLRLCPQARADPKTIARQSTRPLSYYEQQMLNADDD
jgi:hypothetical protein